VYFIQQPALGPVIPGRTGRIGFQEKIHGAQFQSFKRGIAAFAGKAAHHQNGRRILRHNFLQSVQTVHARHFHIQCDDVRMELGNLFQGFDPIPGRSHHLDFGIGIYQPGYRITRKSGVIHY
jgi:hypothetical protein